jgi:hypothetical protein
MTNFYGFFRVQCRLRQQLFASIVIKHAKNYLTLNKQSVRLNFCHPLIFWLFPDT